MAALEKEIEHLKRSGGDQSVIADLEDELDYEREEEADRKYNREYNIDSLREIISFINLSINDYEKEETDAYTIAKQLETRVRRFADSTM